MDYGDREVLKILFGLVVIFGLVALWRPAALGGAIFCLGLAVWMLVDHWRTRSRG